MNATELTIQENKIISEEASDIISFSLALAYLDCVKKE